MLAFFAILLVGFAYVWHRGDLDWVRAVSAERST
jgi:NADH-quinone oxidoreductase subunit A